MDPQGYLRKPQQNRRNAWEIKWKIKGKPQEYLGVHRNSQENHSKMIGIPRNPKNSQGEPQEYLGIPIGIPKKATGKTQESTGIPKRNTRKPQQYHKNTWESMRIPKKIIAKPQEELGIHRNIQENHCETTGIHRNPQNTQEKHRNTQESIGP